jgi:hypothetical protein
MELATRFAAVMKIPSSALIALTLLFPALLAWSAATIGKALKELVLAQRANRAVSERPPVTTGIPVADT